MIDFLRGRIVEIGANFIILEKNGIGVKIFVPSPSNFCIANKDINLYTHLLLRDDEIVLFGFASMEEKELFLMLQKVSGVGPKGALAILNNMPCNIFYQAVLKDDLTALTKTPGIGPKSAKRIILELKEKVPKEAVLMPNIGNIQNIMDRNIRSNVIDALEGLGYSQSEIQEAFRSLESDVFSSRGSFNEEMLLRELLSLLSQK